MCDVKNERPNKGSRVENQLTPGFSLNAAEVQKTVLFTHAELINSRVQSPSLSLPRRLPPFLTQAFCPYFILLRFGDLRPYPCILPRPCNTCNTLRNVPLSKAFIFS